MEEATLEVVDSTAAVATMAATAVAAAEGKNLSRLYYLCTLVQLFFRLMGLLASIVYKNNNNNNYYYYYRSARQPSQYIEKF